MKITHRGPRFPLMGPLLRSGCCLLALSAILLNGSARADAQTPDEAARSQHALLAEVGPARFTAPDFHPGNVRHMVMFRFRQSATPEQRHQVTEHFLALAKESRRPDHSPVVVSIETGVQNSGESSDLGLERAYLVTFRSEGDRNFYVGQPVVADSHYFDAAHEAFKTFAKPYLAKVVVFDFTMDAKAAP